ncbi:MAG: hypothetical protein GWM92_05100, partial [Gemmatimonadetes bacterium]|nr:glycosyltransferase family 9 protein [Gemmatimonadota bacterium]NIT86513.1 glycosyltransferase family 9 protein [Gemmatimonadota bacterium]NIU78968.1 hypothetical protein [Gammaproteobacteria bacterium]NIY12089.1 hypothetical protein [Gemmatimonadota bacterium]NIY38835.1 hypothetical protein [Gemmatimonadota bacterium]
MSAETGPGSVDATTAKAGGTTTGTVGGPEAAGWSGPPPREICIVMLSAIGDAVHVLPVANALKRHWPDARITWVIQPVPHLMVRDHPAIDEFVVFRRRRGWRAWLGFQELMEAMRDRRFDLLL